MKKIELIQTIKVTFVFLFLLGIANMSAHAQNLDKLDYEAKSLEGGNKDGVSYKKLIGNVKITQKKTIIYCDSAMVYDKSNSMEAFGRVKIEDLEDSVTITSDRLYYDGNGKIAELRGDVLYNDDSIKLYTDNLDYDMTNKSAKYFNGGKIIDGINIMESKSGDYDTEGKMMIFTDSVKMTTPDYVLESDDLIYNLITKKARTSSETKITTENGRVLKSKQSSEFDTEKGTSAFLVGEIDTDKYFIRGDELYFDNESGSYSAKGNVYLLAKEDSVIITGDYANFWQSSGIAKVFGDPLLKMSMNNDTLYLRADTLVSINDSLEINRRLLAHKNVTIFKNDLQGKSDSLAYFLSDSSIVFYQDPILWNDGSQITADTIRIVVKNGSLDQLKTAMNSFIISADSTENFNQIKGRHMTAFFNGKSIRDVDVTGNGESIYYVAEEENTKALMGMNKIICSNMKIIFQENQVHDIRFYSNPDGNFVPPHELKNENKQLEGFAWRVDERPTKREIMLDPSEVARKLREVEEMIQAEEQEEKTRLEKLLDENVENDIKRIKETLTKPAETPPQQ